PPPTPPPAIVQILGSTTLSGHISNAGFLSPTPVPFTPAAGGTPLNYARGAGAISAGHYDTITPTQADITVTSGSTSIGTLTLTNCTLSSPDSYMTQVLVNDTTLTGCLGGDATSKFFTLNAVNTVKIANSTVSMVIMGPNADITLGPAAVVYGQ